VILSEITEKHYIKERYAALESENLVNTKQKLANGTRLDVCQYYSLIGSDMHNIAWPSHQQPSWID